MDPLGESSPNAKRFGPMYMLKFSLNMALPPLRRCVEAEGLPKGYTANPIYAI